MEHDELKEGTYCAPANVKEREAILALAESLGLGGWAPDRDGGDYIFVGRLISNGEIRAVDRSVAAFKEQPRSTWKRTNCLYFIAAMYRLAEKRKASPEPQAADIGVDRNIRVRADGVQEWWDGKMWKEFPTHSFNEGAADLLRRVSNLETALNEHMVNFREHIHIIDRKGPNCFTATEIPLEGRYPAAGAGDQVTNDEQARYRGDYRVTWDSRCGPPPESMKNPDMTALENCSCVMIDLGASPKNIPFEVALAYLKAGRRIRRASWLPEAYITQFESRVADYRGFHWLHPTDHIDATFDINGFLATDWEVVPEP